MGGGAFIRLNGGRLNLKTAKQTKICVASLLKILRNSRFELGCRRVFQSDLQLIPQDMANLPE